MHAENDDANPLPDMPELPGALPHLRWRSLNPDDLPLLSEIYHAGLAADGGLPFLFAPEVLQSRFFPGHPGLIAGALAADGRLSACAAVHPTSISGEAGAAIVGMVRPDQRGQGIGSALMQWSQAQAGRLLDGTSTAHASGNRRMQIATESLTDAAHRLYLRHGFTCVMEEFVMRYDLRQPLPGTSLPPGVDLISWQSELAQDFYQAYHAAFRERPGFPGWSAAEWIGHVTENDHIPEWSLLVRDNGVPAGFVIGNIDLTANPPGGYIWQIGVTPEQRRRGLASALLTESMRRMQASGALEALLCVHVNNPGAYQAYQNLGFTTIGRRARYERAAG